MPSTRSRTRAALPVAGCGADTGSVSVLLWGRKEGYRHFNLGMAPLSVKRMAEGDCRCAYRVGGQPGDGIQPAAASPMAGPVAGKVQRHVIPLHLDAAPA